MWRPSRGPPQDIPDQSPVISVPPNGGVVHERLAPGGLARGAARARALQRHGRATPDSGVPLRGWVPGSRQLVQPQGRAHLRGPARRRVRDLPVARVGVQRRHGQGAAGIRGRRAAGVRGRGAPRRHLRRRPAGLEAHRRPAPAAPAAPPGVEAGWGAAPGPRHLDDRHGRGQSALLDLGRAARACHRPRPGARRRDAPGPAEHPELPALRGELLQGVARLHLAVRHHRARPRGPAHGGLRRPGQLVRRGADRHADPVGKRLVALLQDGRAAELRAEPGHDPQQGSDPQQGGRVHHHRRPGQRPGRGGSAVHLLGRAGVRVSALPVHRALERLGRRRHAEQRQAGEGEHRAHDGLRGAGRARARLLAGARPPSGRTRKADGAGRAQVTSP